MGKKSNWTAVVLGALLTLGGTVWFLQGVDVVQGSPMTGVTLWAIVGPIVALLGLGLLCAGLVGLARRRRVGE